MALKYQKIKFHNGFTLVELIISIFIITLITGLFMVNYHSTNKHSQLNMYRQKLVSDIRLAQNYSLGSKTYDGINMPKGGWGVHFNRYSNQYIIFADKNAPNGNQVYDAGEEVETKRLPDGLTVNYLSYYDGSYHSVNSLDIVFYPPDPDIYINGSLGRTGNIRIEENINYSMAFITVNSFGLIYGYNQ